MVTVIIPTFNEEKKIEMMINYINCMSVEKEIIVVNDCSKDRTEAILKSISLCNLKVIHHASRRGKGAAVRTGLENAVGKFIFVLDPKLNNIPSDFSKFTKSLDIPGIDIVLGSRFIKMSYVNRFLSSVFGIKLNDWFSLCQFIKKESFIRMLPELKNVSDSFEILTKASRKKMNIIEVFIDN